MRDDLRGGGVSYFDCAGVAFHSDSPFRWEGQARNSPRSLRGISFFIVRPEMLGYRKGEIFEVKTVLVFGIVHAERDVFGVGIDACYLPMSLTRIAPDRRPAHGIPMLGNHRDIHNRGRADGTKVGPKTHLGLYVCYFKA